MKRWLLPVVWTVFTAALALADGDGPTRTMTGAEAAAYKQLQGTIRAALPATPANYTVAYSGFDSKEVFAAITPDRMCRLPFKVVYRLNPQYTEARQQTALMGMIQGSPEQQAKRDALNAKSEELKKARKKTRDPAEKERIRAELKKLNAEENALTDEIAAGLSAGGAEQAMRGTDAALPAKELSIRILVNQDVQIADRAKPYTVAGASLAFAQQEGCQDSGMSCVTVLLGDFIREKKISGTTQYTLLNANLGVPTKPRGMALIVSGPKDTPETAQNFLHQINLPKLRALLP